MDKELRSAIERATQRARTLLENDFIEQLEGTYDVLRSGKIPESGGQHLDIKGRFRRDKIIAAVEHKKSSGMKAGEAVLDYIRDAAFTSLNRFVALKMLEARDLVQECISKGEQSDGFRWFTASAPAVGTLPGGDGYRLFLECIFDELSTEIKVLFDRRDVASVLWPRRHAFDHLLELLNTSELTGAWVEDETIGWVYQYFNSAEERRAMRDASQAPRSSRELAIRNQFFTPRYVVQFLTDNTLGRIWYEMQHGETALKERCEYMVRRSHELFRGDPAHLGDAAPWVVTALDGDFEAIPEDLNWETACAFAHGIDGYASAAALGADASAIAKSVRDAFDRTGQITARAGDLWITLFMEYRGDRHSGGYGGGAAGQFRDPLCQALRAALLEAKKNGTSVDPVALVPFRAKKDPRDLRVLDPACGSGHFLLYAFGLLLTIYEESWDDLHRSTPPSEATGNGLHDDYPDKDAFRRAIPSLILRHNLHGVEIDPRCAQIAQLALWMRAQRAFRDLGVDRAERPLIRRSSIVVAEPLVTDDGALEEFLGNLGDKALARTFADLVQALNLAGDLGLLLRVERLIAREPKRGQTGELFAPPEERIRAALAKFVAGSGDAGTTRRRLFADDAAQGVGLLETAEKRFDVVLMNPPFGAGSTRAKKDFDKAYPRTKNDVYAAFIERGIELLSGRGRLGAITSRTGFFLSSFQKWREDVVLKTARPVVVADLGMGVLDAAMVETAAYCLEACT